MQIIPDLQKYKARSSRPVILALGNFDGFHLGHQKLLRYVAQQARKYHGLAAVLTFPQHPHSMLHPSQKPLMLTSLEQKLFYLAHAGIDLCFLQSFTKSFAKMTPQDFVEKLLVKRLHIREICMGYDAHFGRGREGDTELMKKLAGKHGFLFRKMKPVRVDRKPVSSSRIRGLLMKGRIEKVREFLGRPFSLFGKVVRGKGHGFHLGFPTANLEVHSDVTFPLGVYVASGRFLSRAKLSDRVSGKWIPGVMNFGKRPTYPKAETPRPILELHLLDFCGKIYGERVEIALHRFVRSEKKFRSEKALRECIQQDIRIARRFHKAKRYPKT